RARGRAARRSHCRDARGGDRRERCAARPAGRSSRRRRARADGHAATPDRAGAVAAAGGRGGRCRLADAAGLNAQLAAAWRVLPDYLGQHVVLSASALTLGLLISMPLMLIALRNERVRWFVLAFASLVQTIPSLALLALFYPLLLALSAAAVDIFGAGFPALGFLPALLALTLYSMLPIIRNGVTGIVNLDPDVI